MTRSKERYQRPQKRAVETRPGVITVDLRGEVRGGASIEFLCAETSNELAFPFAVVRYALEGREAETGLRIDLDKRVFLDHFDDDSQKEAVCRRAAPELASLIASGRSGLV